MIKATFKKNYYLNSIGLICGLFLIFFSLYVDYKDNNSSFKDLIFLLILGLFFCLLNVIFLLYNFKAYLYIDSGRIKGRFGWFSKIDCDVADVDFAFAQINALTIILKNGKHFVIGGILDPCVFCTEIRKNIIWETQEPPEKLKQNLNDLKREKKKSVIYVWICMALTIINIFATVFFTGARELDEFDKYDWIIFCVMGVIEILIYCNIFVLIKGLGKKNIQIEKIQYVIPKMLIETQELLPGNVIKVFTDTNYTLRIVVYSTYNDEAFYFSLEYLEWNGDYNLTHRYNSDICNEEDLMKEFEIENFPDLIEITEKFDI